MSESPHLYDEISTVFADRVSTADLSLRVPACPGWSLKELLAHQVHQLQGWVDGSFPVDAGIDALVAAAPEERLKASDAQSLWIEQGIAELRTVPAGELLDHWRQLVDLAPSGILDALLPDAAVHLFDLLGALGDRSLREQPVVAEALRFWVTMADSRLRALGWQGLQVQLDDGPVLGAKTTDVIVGGPGFEALRTLTGRRSRSQAEARLRLPAVGSAVDELALYGWRETALDE